MQLSQANNATFFTDAGFRLYAVTPSSARLLVLALAYRTGVPWNESAYSNKQFDELLGKTEGTIDVAARSEVLGELEKIMQEDGPIRPGEHVLPGFL